MTTPRHQNSEAAVGEALREAQRLERAAADQVAGRFLSARPQLVARASANVQPISARQWGLRHVLAAAAVLAMCVGAGLVLRNQQSAGSPAFTASKRTIITDSGSVRPSAIAAEPTLESRIKAAKAGSVLELKSGNFATAMIVRKPVRLVAVDGAVRIGVNVSEAQPETQSDTAPSAS